MQISQSQNKKGYEQKVVTENGFFKGYILLNDEVVASTNRCATFREATLQTRDLLISVTEGKTLPAQSNDAEKPKIYRLVGYPSATPTINTSVTNTEEPIVYNYEPKPRKCCGRG